jgi:hypothetical protein
MNLDRQHPRREQQRLEPRIAALRPAELAANDGLGDYMRPSTEGIVVEELSREEFEALLALQRSPA